MPTSSAHHYRRARASPSTAPGHARAATHARRAIRRASRASRRPTPVFERGKGADTKGADPDRRLRIAARLTACQLAHISCYRTDGIAPTGPTFQFNRPVGGRAGGDQNRRGRQRRSPGGARPFGGTPRRAISFAASCQLLGAATKASSARVSFCAACQEHVYEPLPCVLPGAAAAPGAIGHA